MVGEFFATSSIRNLAESVVREGIQNALDAGIRNDVGRFEEPVEIRISLRSGENSVRAADHKQFLSGIWPHINAPGNGLIREEIPQSREDCPCLLFEDFNTYGLTGDPAQSRDIEGEKNPFFHFFRAEGRSAKSGDERGRWGVGKYVFPRSSRIKTIFGYTVRADDGRALLMGSSVLRSHAVSDIDFLPDGLFGIRAKDERDFFVMPEDNPSLLAEFRNIFGLRRASESGLSIIVPWIDDSVTKDALIAAVVSGYFAPLLDGSLKVSISENSENTELDAETLMDEANRIRELEVAKVAALANWGADVKPNDYVKLGIHSGNKPEWNDALLADGQLEFIKAKLEDAERRVAIRVPIRVRRKNQDPQLTEFRILLEEDRAAKERPVFVRDGILISDVRAPRDAGIRALVLIDEKPIAALLGDAENPAHTQWQRDSSNFRGKYDYGEACIRFVSQAAHEILARLRAKDQQGDPWILADIFYLDDPAGEPDKDGLPKPRQTEPETSDTKPRTAPANTPKFYRVQYARGGFSLSPGTVAPPVLPAQLTLEVAYDIRRGNPFSKYAPDDFHLIRPPVRIDGKEQGLRLTKAEKNILEVELREASFALTVTGFDTKRDLIVRVFEEKHDHDTEI